MMCSIQCSIVYNLHRSRSVEAILCLMFSTNTIKYRIYFKCRRRFVVVFCQFLWEFLVLRFSSRHRTAGIIVYL